MNNDNYEVLDMNEDNSVNISIPKKQKKLPIIPIVLGCVIIALFIALFFQSNKIKELNKIKNTCIVQDETKQENDDKNNSNNTTTPFNNTDISIFEVAALNVTGKFNNLSESINYIEDYNAKYAFSYTVALNKLEYKMVDSDELDLIGAARFKLDEFNSLYESLFDEKFDISKLYAQNSIYNSIGFPKTRENYIYGKYQIGTNKTHSMEYRYINYDFDESQKEYALNFNALYNDELENNPILIYMGILRIKFKLKDDGKIKMISINYINEE